MRFYLSIFVLFVSGTFVFADQYQSISKETAEQAKEILLEMDTLVEWCHCCDTALITTKKFAIKSVEFLPEKPYSQWCELKITVYYSDTGTKVLRNADLAYLHIRDEDYSISIAEFLGLKSYQCGDAFKWDDIQVE